MNTAEYIKWVQKRTGNQVTDEEMRVLVNIAQNEIFSLNTEITRHFQNYPLAIMF